MPPSFRTDCESRWRVFAIQFELPEREDELVVMPRSTLRQMFREIFSYGVVHAEAERKRIEALLPRGTRDV